MELLNFKGTTFETEIYAHLRNLDYRQKIIHQKLKDSLHSETPILLTEIKRIDC
jgi:hypothetical protein